MAKLVSEDAYALISTLSKSEKRYFKLYTGIGSNDRKKFIALFDTMATMKPYDEQKILKKVKGIKPAQLPNMKAYLYKQVLGSLSAYHASRQSDVVTRQMINDAVLLYNKGLYAQALKMLDKAKQSAVSNNHTILLLDIIEQEKTFISHTIAENNESRVTRIVDETKKVVEHIRKANRFSNLAAKLNSFYVEKGFVRNRKDYLQVRKYFISNLPTHREKELSFNEKLYLYLCYISYYFFLQDFEKGYQYTLRYMQLFDDKPELRVQKFELYVKGLNYRLVAEHKLWLLPAFEETYRQLMKAQQLKGTHMTEHLQMLLFKYKYMHKINHYFMRGEFSAGCRIIHVAESELDRFATRMDKHHTLMFYYKVACLYFGAGRYDKALAWLNKIINSRDVNIRSDILSFARILSLICHYELGNTDTVDYLIRSTYRFLLKKEGRYRYFEYIIRFLKSLSKQKPLIQNFAHLKQQLQPLEKHAYEKRPFLYFDIIAWLESKIHGIPTEEVVQARLPKPRRR